MMHPDPFPDLEVAYDRLVRRPPRWVDTPALSRYGELDGVITAIRNDYPNPDESDSVVRTLIALGRVDPSAITVLL